MRILLALLLLPAPVLAELVIDNAWIQNLPPSVPVRAGYLRLSNPGPLAAKIVGLHGEGFTLIEIHRSVTTGGMMRMQPLPTLEIEAGETLDFEPGGLHLMMHAKRPTRPGEHYRIVIELEDGARYDIEMTVRK